MESTLYNVEEIIPSNGTIYIDSEQFFTKYGSNVKKIGSGSFGTVYQTSKDYAVKKTKANVCIYKGIPNSFIKETLTMHFLNHPNIVKVYNLTVNSNRCEFEYAMPLATDTLHDVFIKYGKIDLITRKLMFYQLIQALNNCHQQLIWHLDIKPENILIFNDGTYRLTDFGLAELFAFKGTEHTITGSYLWRAPELFLGDKLYDETVDLWALGIVMLEAILGRDPYNVEKVTELLPTILQLIGSPDKKKWPALYSLSEYRIYSPLGSIKGNLVKLLQNEGSPPDEIDLMRKILTWPYDRINTSDALKHEYFNDPIIRPELKPHIPEIDNWSCGIWMINHQVKIPNTAEYYIKSDRIRITKFSNMIKLARVMNIEFISVLLAQWIYTLYGSLIKVESSELDLLLVTSLLIGTKVRQQESPALLQLSRNYIAYSFIKNRIKLEDIQQMEENVLIAIDFDLVVPLAIDFVRYIFIKDSHIKYATRILLLLYTNYDWITNYSQYSLALTSIYITQQHFELLPGDCLFELPTDFKIIDDLEIREYMEKYNRQLLSGEYRNTMSELFIYLDI